jgi:hypothetical protein
MSIGDFGTGKKLKSFSLFGDNFEFARAEHALSKIFLGSRIVLLFLKLTHETKTQR